MDSRVNAEYRQITIRIPIELFHEIDAKAKATNRTRSRLIVYLLKRVFELLRYL